MITSHPLDSKFKSIVKNYRRCENDIIDCLQEIDRDRTFKLLGFDSLCAYAESRGLSTATALSLIGIARKSVAVPELKAAINSGELLVSKAHQIVGVLEPENSSMWIQKAKDLPKSKLEKEVAATKPESAIKERLKPVCKDRIELKLGISEALEKKIKRIQELVSSKSRQYSKIENALEAMADCYLKQHDPIEKENRRIGKAGPTPKSFVALRRQALHRDNGQCRHKDPTGKRCSNRRWVEVHHRTPKSEGGKDTLENLITLCSHHHNLQHGPGFHSSQEEQRRKRSNSSSDEKKC